MIHSTLQCAAARLKRLPAAFYATGNGREPVREWLQSLNEEDRHSIGEDIAAAEFGWPIGMPVCRPPGKGLWEIRSNVSAGRIARIVFAVLDQRMVLLHGFVKKTRKTPKPDLDLALKRMKEIPS